MEPRAGTDHRTDREASSRSRRTPDRFETRVFRGALGLVALGVIDDAFLHPEAGVTAGDHLAGGLVPLAFAAALAAGYPRLAPGVRGLAAMACGVLALAAGVADGFRHVAIDRMQGDDIAVMLAGIAGAALILLGTATLWRSRRRDERPVRRYARRTVALLAAVVATVYVVVPVTVAIVATHRAREPVTAADLGRPYERVHFTTRDGLRLAGWYVPSRNGAAVIVSPGRRGPVPHARMLARHGYGVLLFDRRGEGESDGDFNAFGWGGDADLVAAIDFLGRRSDVHPAQIGGLGLSVGGEMLLETAAEDPRLRAVVSEGAGIRSLREHWDDPQIGAVQRPFTPLVAQTAAVAVLADRRPPASLVDLVSDIAPRALLLIRGLEGQPAEVLNREFLRAAGQPKELWEVPGAGHTAALSARPQEYERRVVAFFDRALETHD
jgi:hypothetical protein